MNRIGSWYGTKLLCAILLSGLAVGVAWGQKPAAPPATPAPAANPTPAPAPNPAPTPGPAVASSIPPDTVVLKVGGKQFTRADIDQLIKNLGPQAQRSIDIQGKKLLGDSYATVVALAEQAQRQKLDQTPGFIQKLAFQKEQMEAQAAYDDINQKATVTPEEVQKYYEAHLSDYEQVEARQIVVRKKMPDPKLAPGQAAPPTGPGMTAEEAKARAEAIRKELLAGTDIKKVMDDFKSPGDIVIEQEPRTIRKGGMRPDMEKIAFALKAGEVSEPLDIPQALIFYQVLKTGHAELKDVTPEIERKLHQEKVEAAMNAVKKDANIWMDEQYFAPAVKPQVAPPAAPPTVQPPPKP